MTTVQHGYTLQHVHHLARQATRTIGHFATDHGDRYHDAWSAIVERLLTAEQAPTRQELWYTGRDAVLDSIGADRRHYGAGRDWRAQPRTAPGFVRYWNQAAVTHDFSSSLVERHAAQQIWARMSRTHREVLQALADTGDLKRTAALLGLGVDTTSTRLRAARAAFRALWHEHETAPAGQWRRTVPAKDDAALKPCGTYAAWQRHRYRREEMDPACRTAGIAYQQERRAAKRADQARTDYETNPSEAREGR